MPFDLFLANKGFPRVYTTCPRPPARATPRVPSYISPPSLLSTRSSAHKSNHGRYTSKEQLRSSAVTAQPAPAAETSVLADQSSFFFLLERRDSSFVSAYHVAYCDGYEVSGRSAPTAEDSGNGGGEASGAQEVAASCGSLLLRVGSV